MFRAKLGLTVSSRSSGSKLSEEDLKKEGWMRRFTADEPRLSEAVELYRSLGYEVHLTPAEFKEENELCKTCIQAECQKYRIIYIRPRQAEA